MFLAKRIKQSRGWEAGWTNEQASGWQTNDTKEKNGKKNGRCQFGPSESIPRRNKKRENGKKERRDPISPPRRRTFFLSVRVDPQIKPRKEWGLAQGWWTHPKEKGLSKQLAPHATGFRTCERHAGQLLRPVSSHRSTQSLWNTCRHVNNLRTSSG